MPRSKIGELEPQLFENDLQVQDPREVDELYNGAYLAQRDVLAGRIAAVRDGHPPLQTEPPQRASRFVETGEGLVIEPPVRKVVTRYRPRD